MTRNPRTAVLATLLGDLAMALAKLVVAGLTHSAVLVAEGVHSLGAAGSQGLLLLGIRLSRSPSTGMAPVGYARERYFWGSVVVFGVFVLGGAFSVHAGLVVILAGGAWPGDAVASFGVLGLAAALVAVATHGTLRQYLVVVRGKSFREAFLGAKDPTVAMTLLEDGAGVLGVVVAAAGTGLARATGRAAWDGAAALLVGLLLAARAGLTALKAKRLLLGEAAARADQEKIRRILALQPGIERVNDVTALHLAPSDVLLGLDVDFRQDVGFDEIRRILYNVEYRVREAMPHMKRVYIEVGSVMRFWERGTERTAERSSGPPR